MKTAQGPRQPDDIDRAASDVIRAIRKRAKLTLEDVAGETISHQQLQKYETSTNRMSVGRFCQIAARLGRNPASVLRRVLRGAV